MKMEDNGRHIIQNRYRLYGRLIFKDIFRQEEIFTTNLYDGLHVDLYNYYVSFTIILAFFCFVLLRGTLRSLYWCSTFVMQETFVRK